MKPTRTLLAALAGLTASAFSQTADTIYHNGPILTIDDTNPRAEAVAVKDGKILAVGKKDDVLKTKGDATRLVDLSGRTMLPGFVDAHGHVFVGGIQALSANLLAPPDGDVTDIASMQEAIRQWMKANEAAVKKVNLVFGFGYDNSTLAERRHPTRDDLDQISKDIPVCLWHQSGHIVAINSKAIEIVGTTAETPNPQGGVIRRKKGTQEPDGVYEELAAMPVLAKLLGQTGPDGAKVFAKAGAELWARFGYTTADEGRSFPSTTKVMEQVANEGGFKIDVAAYPDSTIDREFIKANFRADYKNRFRVAGAKLTIDGSPQGFTAWRDRPYYNPVGDYPPGYSGYAAATREQVLDITDWAYANNIQLLTHSNGEAAHDLLIAALSASTAKHGGGDRRSVLIHGQFLREDQVDSYQKLGVLPSLFPMHTFYWGDWHRDHTVGPVLAENISPTGWCVQRGMKFTTHHDAPVAFPDSMRVLDATVTRRSRSGDILGPHQRVDVMTALKAMTIWPAWQHFEEKSKGSIETGKLADFVILDKDPTAIDPETLDTIKVTETVKEGTTVYLAGQKEGAHLSRPDERGEHAFSNFIRHIASAEGHDHGHATNHCCGCEVAALLGNALASSGRH